MTAIRSATVNGTGTCTVGMRQPSVWADILPEGRGKQQARYACVHEAPLLVEIGL